MNLRHGGNWRVAGQLDAGHDALVDVYECPLCFAITRDPNSHADFHEWTGTEHPYSPRRCYPQERAS